MVLFVPVVLVIVCVRSEVSNSSISPCVSVRAYCVVVLLLVPVYVLARLLFELDHLAAPGFGLSLQVVITICTLRAAN